MEEEVTSISDNSIDPGVDIGHVHLRVADLDRSIAFYAEALGFDLSFRIPDMAFLAAGGYHHHIALNTRESRGGSRPPAGTTGLNHVAFRYPTREALGRAVQRVINHGTEVSSAADEGFSLAAWLEDPDGNGIELCWDRPREEWPATPEGHPHTRPQPIPIEALLGPVS